MKSPSLPLESNLRAVKNIVHNEIEKGCSPWGQKGQSLLNKQLKARNTGLPRPLGRLSSLLHKKFTWNTFYSIFFSFFPPFSK